MRIKHLNSLNEEEGRLTKLNQRKNDSLTQILELKQNYHSLQQTLHEAEQKLKILGDQKQHLIDRGGDELKIKKYQTDISELEEKAFGYLEELEQNEVARTDLGTFLEGLEKTILEIANEVHENKKKEDVEVANLDLRLTLIHQELPEDFKKLLDKTLAKKLAHGPFTRTDQGSCFFCRFKISRTDESEIDMQRALKVCPQCSRIFIPYGT